MDILLLNWKSRDQLLLQSGTGGFVDATIKNLPLSRHLNTTSAVTGDLDGDGDLDLLVGNGWWSSEDSTEVLWSNSKLLMNSGNGRFTDGSHTRLPGHLPRIGVSAVKLIDIDGDMDLDVVVGRSLARNQIWINDGGGAFHETRLLK